MIPSFSQDALSLFERIRHLAGDEPVYLVGGSVRDAILGREASDFDFVISSGSIELAHKVKRVLHGVAYTLDDDRKTARVILHPGTKEEIVLDFVSFTGETLTEDLRNRDFTLNAMAINLAEQELLIDPLGGMEDLQAKRLKIASTASMQLDPLRCMRAARMCIQFGLAPSEETLGALKDAAPRLLQISGERVRDELFKLMRLGNFSRSLRLLRSFDLLGQVFPHINEILELGQFPPHVHDLWTHTLQVISYLEALISADEDLAENNQTSDFLSRAIQYLQPFQNEITKDLDQPLQAERPRKLLLLLAALYHDVGKRGSQGIRPDGRIRFYEHPILGMRLVEDLSRKLMLGVDEARYLQLMVANHMRIHLLSKPTDPPSRRAIYRFYGDLGAYGVDSVLHSLADLLSSKESSLDPVEWERELRTAGMMLEAWYRKHGEIIAPSKLLDGVDLMREFNLEPGPLLGKILNELHEAQAAGEVTNREVALKFSREILARSHSENLREKN